MRWHLSIAQYINCFSRLCVSVHSEVLCLFSNAASSPQYKCVWFYVFCLILYCVLYINFVVLVRRYRRFGEVRCPPQSSQQADPHGLLTKQTVNHHQYRCDILRPCKFCTFDMTLTYKFSCVVLKVRDWFLAPTVTPYCVMSYHCFALIDITA